MLHVEWQQILEVESGILPGGQSVPQVPLSDIKLFAEQLRHGLVLLQLSQFEAQAEHTPLLLYEAAGQESRHYAPDKTFPGMQLKQFVADETHPLHGLEHNLQTLWASA